MAASWSYEEAFKRNLGLINPNEQQILRNKRVAIAGLGGVGGVHLMTLARMGIGKFTIADADTFEVANFNRQYGASISRLHQSKAAVMAELVKDINPEADIRVFDTFITKDNAADFLQGADLLIDGFDAFSIDARRDTFNQAAKMGIFALTAGPIGFSTAWIVFDPKGIRFDDYFNLNDDMDTIKKFSSFIWGLVPKTLHRSYIDESYVDTSAKSGPSAGLACQLASGIVAAEALKILLHRGPLRVAPWYHQFDAYKAKLVVKRLPFGNKGPLQRIKIHLFDKFLRKNLKK